MGWLAGAATAQVADGRPSVQAPPHAITGYEGERRRVLIADDVAPNRAMLVDLLHGLSLQAALEHVTAAVYEVMLKTHEMGEYELQLVAAQDAIVRPTHVFPAEKL